MYIRNIVLTTSQFPVMSSLDTNHDNRWQQHYQSKFISLQTTVDRLLNSPILPQKCGFPLVSNSTRPMLHGSFFYRCIHTIGSCILIPFSVHQKLNEILQSSKFSTRCSSKLSLFPFGLRSLINVVKFDIFGASSFYLNCIPEKYYKVRLALNKEL